MSRWRESSGRSFGSQIVPPGESSCGNACDEPDEVLEVVHRRLAPLVSLAHERAAVDGREDHVVAADVHGALRVARLQVELARRLRDLLEDEVRVELDDRVLDLLAGLAEVLDRLREDELDPELADDPAPAAVERRHRVLREDLVARHRVDDHATSTSSCRSSPASPTSRISSGSPRRSAALSAALRSSGVGDCASQSTRV